MSGPNHESEPVHIVNDNDIADELRRLSNSPTEAILVSASLLEEAADEIDRLRALITAWNKAEREYFNAVNPSPDVVARFYSALDAFRAEVRR